MGIRWGVVTDNPCRNVKRLPEKKRDRYVTDDEYNRICNLAAPPLRNMIKFAYLTGLRQSDVRKVKINDLWEDGIYAEVNKTGNKILLEWTSGLRAVVDDALAIAHAMNSEWLFPCETGKAYSDSGIQTAWQRLIRTAIDKEIITERFTFHDLRRKTATDAEHNFCREYARKLLCHTDQKTTEIYISGIRKVKPLGESIRKNGEY